MGCPAVPSARARLQPAPLALREPARGSGGAHCIGECGATGFTPSGCSGRTDSGTGIQEPLLPDAATGVCISAAVHSRSPLAQLNGSILTFPIRRDTTAVFAGA